MIKKLINPSLQYFKEYIIFSFLFCFFFLSITFCFGQDLSYTIYNQSQGLPHHHVYSVLQDSKGLIWFTTETGVSCFNGVSFTNYFASDGLTDNEILEVHEGTDGKIWFMSYAPGISYYKNRKIYNNQNDSILSPIKFNTFVKQMCNTTNGNIYLLTEGNELYLLSGKELKLVTASNIPNDTIRYLWKGVNNDIWGLTSTYYFDINNGINIESKYPILQIHTATITLKNSMLVRGSEKGIILFDGHIEKLIIPYESIKSSINFIYTDRDDNLWLMLKRGVMYFENTKNGWEKRGFFLKDYTITRMTQDSEGGMWFATTDRGVLYAPSLKVTNYFQKTTHSFGEAYCISRDKAGNMLFGLGGDKIGMIGNGIQTILPLNINKTDLPHRILNILSRDDSSIWIGGDNGVWRIKNLNSNNQLHVYDSPCKKIMDNGNSVIGGFSIGTIELEENYTKLALNKKNLAANLKRKLFNQRTHAIAIINDSTILIGTTNGLQLFKDTTIIPYPAKNPVTKRITDIKVAKDGSIWFSTFGWGIGVIKGKTITEISQKNGLISNICKSIFIDENSQVWIGTDKGISKVQLDTNHQIDVTSYTTRDGLPSNDINAIYVWEDTVWVASAVGISSFKTTVPLRNKTHPLVYIEHLAINRHDTILEKHTTFPSDSNNITFYFTGISYQSFGQVTYKYRLKGMESAWNTTNASLVRYSSIPAGDYLFEVFAISADHLESKFPATFSFTILPHFMFSKPVIAAEFILLVLLLIFLVYFVSSTTKAKEKRKTELAIQFAESEMRALRAQMNPHFIFNSINTLQGFIIDSDKKAAYEYLEKFGSLMRNILEQSVKKWITLQDEMDTLNIYITLESKRFDNKFDYSILVSKDMNPKKILIPPMLLQPYIENAIKHGIIPKIGKGNIEISFNIDKDMLICSIKDNGIGRKKSQEIKSGHKHKSFGMDITKQRINLLSKIFFDERYNVLIHDLFSEQKIETGTLVEIFIPLTNFKDNYA